MLVFIIVGRSYNITREIQDRQTLFLIQFFFIYFAIFYLTQIIGLLLPMQILSFKSDVFFWLHQLMSILYLKHVSKLLQVSLKHILYLIFVQAWTMQPMTLLWSSCHAWPFSTRESSWFIFLWVGVTSISLFYTFCPASGQKLQYF